ncbi:MAG: small acid-soluble spore protein SspI [Erysipelotrichaceae bacterium]|nr:small acid-soluble spore protein SspI [Erysipelotrichaceae bacterium]
MDNIDIRKYIINNFKEDSTKEIEKSITSSIESKSEDPLIGLGVLFELMWNNSTNDIKDTILSSIKKGLTNS